MLQRPLCISRLRLLAGVSCRTRTTANLFVEQRRSYSDGGVPFQGKADLCRQCSAVHGADGRTNAEDDRVLLREMRTSTRYLTQPLTADGEQEVSHGRILHKDIIGCTPKDSVKSHKGV